MFEEKTSGRREAARGGMRYIDTFSTRRRKPGAPIALFCGSRCTANSEPTVEVHVVGLVHFRCVGRRRPVVAGRPGIVNRETLPVAGSWQERTTLGSKGSPLGRGTLSGIAAAFVDFAKRGEVIRSIRDVDAVWEQDDAIYAT